jgi:hypothetical protein
MVFLVFGWPMSVHSNNSLYSIFVAGNRQKPRSKSSTNNFNFQESQKFSFLFIFPERMEWLGGSNSNSSRSNFHDSCWKNSSESSEKSEKSFIDHNDFVSRSRWSHYIRCQNEFALRQLHALHFLSDFLLVHDLRVGG